VSVSATPLRRRWNNLSCNWASRTAIEWLTALAVRSSSFAARVMFRLRAVASNASSALSDGNRFGREPPKLARSAVQLLASQMGIGSQCFFGHMR
jgi:hypothetical protein